MLRSPSISHGRRPRGTPYLEISYPAQQCLTNKSSWLHRVSPDCESQISFLPSVIPVYLGTWQASGVLGNSQPLRVNHRDFLPRRSFVLVKTHDAPVTYLRLVVSLLTFKICLDLLCPSWLHVIRALRYATADFVWFQPRLNIITKVFVARKRKGGIRQSTELPLSATRPGT